MVGCGAGWRFLGVDSAYASVVCVLFCFMGCDPGNNAAQAKKLDWSLPGCWNRFHNCIALDHRYAGTIWNFGIFERI